MILNVVIALVVIIALGLLVRAMVGHANRLEKMGWIFFHQFVLLSDERALSGFRLIYCILAPKAKAQFREMIHKKHLGCKALAKNEIDDPELEALPDEEKAAMYQLMEGTLPRIADCQAYALKRADVPASHLKTIKQVFAQADPELVRAVNRADLSFAWSLHPNLEVTDYHKFASY